MRTTERELYAWVQQSSPEDAVFLVPPDLENFRLHARRAIVVDWKSTPIVPEELLEWRDRILAISGADAVGSRREAVQGYATIDAARLAALGERYRARFAVLDLKIRGDVATLPCAPEYRNERYAVCRLP
jgi:hypothetical protein